MTVPAVLSWKMPEKHGKKRAGPWSPPPGGEGRSGEQSNDPHNNQHNPQYANYWAQLTRKQHTMPHPTQPQHTDHWAPRTRRQHQREHRLHRPTESSDRRNMRREERVTVQGPVKEQQPDVMSHRDWKGGSKGPPVPQINLLGAPWLCLSYPL